MKGINAVTIACLLAGLLVHGLTQLWNAKRANKTITLRAYFFEHWPESVIALLCSSVLYLGLPELGSYFPDLAKSIGAAGKQTVLSSFAAGFFGNWFTNFLSKRASALFGAPKQ